MLFTGMSSKVDRTVLEGASHLNNKHGPWWKDRGLRTLNFLIFIPLMSEYVQGYDASLINNVQQLPSWQKEFHNPTGSLLGILSASYWVGNVVGVFFITPLSDRYGRRVAMFFGSLVAIIGTALCTGAVNGEHKRVLSSKQSLTLCAAGMFIAGRLLLGIGGVVVGAIGPVLVAELAYPTTALSNTQYSMGIFLLPESPRWLVSKGREDAALAVLAKYHANGDREDEVVQFEYREIVGTIELEISAKQTKWSSIWSTPGNKWRIFIMIWFGICKQWSGNGVVSYYLHTMLDDVGITTTLDQTLITATSQMFSFACSVGFAFLPARVGRRPLLLWSMALMWLVFTIITILTGVFTHTGSKSASYASVAFIYLYSGVHNLGQVKYA
ncbi:Lactose permease [Lachnellula suecica]|uniref:Lactose permease n=1 Tax=Lachnellula suecica TaxID=602035 RepID=A0A8T9CD25_9HELO|nr:Lactose permease [Lachnellula suecica]